MGKLGRYLMQCNRAIAELAPALIVRVMRSFP